ncbi:PREDICTED: uncharacterized protein LOC105458913 [Wasmannia auropunctata]|uniref:uncharacterized protein LOC105458913 n=1 Tax=Wasmannia auropunctata TaxID=64793 RepID=UPI0005EF0D64|nr:PREDICTED: uncharacterized protein LOC105458913 [Wasmannia auropunctata]
MPTQLRANLCTDNVTVTSLWKIIPNRIRGLLSQKGSTLRSCNLHTVTWIKTGRANPISITSRSRFKRLMCAIASNKNPRTRECLAAFGAETREFMQVQIIFQSWCRDLHRVESVHCIAGFYAPKSGDLLR